MKKFNEILNAASPIQRNKWINQIAQKCGVTFLTISAWRYAKNKNPKPKNQKIISRIIGIKKLFPQTDKKK
jgi:transcriptional regulator with XRE-family HTH domain